MYHSLGNEGVRISSIQPNAGGYADTLPIRERFSTPHEGQTSPPQWVQYLPPQLPHLYTEKDFSAGLAELLSGTREQFGQFR